MFLTEADAELMLAALRREALQGSTLQESLQRAMEDFHKNFVESVVLARTYATITFGALPARDRSFVVRAVTEKGNQSHALHQETPVLSLLGTAGVEQAWCDRYRSRGHLAIPLLSEEFVSGSPMVAGLVRQLGMSVDRVFRSMVFGSRAAAPTGAEDFGAFAESFFVRDAVRSRDHAGRLLIPAQDFVRTYGVRTVLGVGGQYSPAGMVLVCVVFSREALHQTPTWLLRLPLLLGTSTRQLVSEGKLFPSDQVEGTGGSGNAA
jgi:hypothetical protein